MRWHERERDLSPGPFGAFFLILWVLSQQYERPSYGIFRFLDLAIRHGDSGYLLAAVALLVAVNALRALFLYEGWFLLASSLAEAFKKPPLERVVPLAAVPLCYQAVAWLDLPAVPHFGMPAVLGLAGVVMIQYLSRGVSRWGRQALVLGLLLLSLQWLDVIPLFTAYGFGWGELSTAVKDLAALLGAETVLNIAGLASFLGFFAGALVTTELLLSYEKQLAQFRRLRRQERELAALREKQLSGRVTSEIQRLVHDLKRPLTTVTGLADVLAATLTDVTAKRHASIIVDAAATMDQMVSEILSPQARRPVTVGELLDYAVSQLRPLSWGGSIAVEADKKVRSLLLSINLVRLSRALVNLLDNAHRATTDSVRSRLFLSAAREGEDLLLLSVEDNGPGMGTRPRPHRSGWGSTGLGLPFVEEVMREHGGALRYGRSDRLAGAAVSLVLPLLKGGDFS